MPCFLQCIAHFMTETWLFAFMVVNRWLLVVSMTLLVGIRYGT